MEYVNVKERCTGLNKLLKGDLIELGAFIWATGTKNLLQSISEKQGRHMKTAESKKDIPKFIEFFKVSMTSSYILWIYIYLLGAMSFRMCVAQIFLWFVLVVNCMPMSNGMLCPTSEQDRVIVDEFKEPVEYYKVSAFCSPTYLFLHFFAL